MESTSPLQSPPFLLVVEDHDDFAALIEDLLEESGYRSLRAATLAEAREMLKKQRFDAVLLDLGLPDSQDILTWEVIHADDPNMPIIMVTGQDDAAMAARALRTGAQDYIVKTELVGAGLDRAIRYAIERQWLVREAERARDEAAALAQRQSVLAKIGRLVSSADDLYEVFDQVSEQMAFLLPFDRVSLNLVDWATESFVELLVYGEGLPGRSPDIKLPLKGSGTESVCQAGEGLVFSSAEMRRLASSRSTVKQLLDHGYVSFIGTPLIAQSRPLGAMFVASKTESQYDAEAAVLLQEVADHIAGAVGQLEAQRRAVKLAERQAAVAALGRALTQSLDLDTILKKSAPFIEHLAPADYVAVNLINEDGETFKVRYLTGEPIPGTVNERKPLAGSATELVTESRRILNLKEEFQKLSSERKFPSDQLVKAGIRSGLAVPLVVGVDAIGTIVWLDRDPDLFDDFDIDIAVTVSVQVAGALANAELHHRSLQLAAETEERMRLEVANRDLEASNEVKSQVISNVSHELRTPLTSMLVFADLLHRNREANLTRDQLIQTGMIRRGGRLLDLLINDLLTMSRLNSGTFKLDITTFKLSQMLDDLVNLMQSVAETKYQTISTELNGEDFEITSDTSRLSQVLCNLVSNASKYSKNNTTITVSAERDGESFSISVTDQGAGIPEDEHEAIFRRFHRINNDATRSEHGTGLGLHIVQSLLQLLGGSISVESEVGKGSTFTVRLPVNQEAAGIVEAA